MLFNFIGDLTNARALFESAYCAIAEKRGPADPELQTITQHLADTLNDLGDYDAAEFYCRTALENLRIHCEERGGFRGHAMMMISFSLADVLVEKTVSKGEVNLPVPRIDETTAADLDEAEELYKFTLTSPDHSIAALRKLNRIYIMRKKRGPDVEATLRKEIEVSQADSRQSYVVTSMKQLCQYLEDGLLGGTAESTTILSPELFCEEALKLRDSLMNLIGNIWLEVKKDFDHEQVSSTRERLDKCAFQYVKSGMIAWRAANEEASIASHCTAVDSMVDRWIQLPASPVTPPATELATEQAVVHDLELAISFFSAGVALLRLADDEVRSKSTAKSAAIEVSQTSTNDDSATRDETDAAKIADGHLNSLSAIAHAESPNTQREVMGSESCSDSHKKRCDSYSMKAAELFKQALVLFDLRLGEANRHSFECVDRITYLASITLQFVESNAGVWMEYFDRAIDYWRTKCDEHGCKKPDNDNESYRRARNNLAQALKRCGNFRHHQMLYFTFLLVQNESAMCIVGSTPSVRAFVSGNSDGIGNAPENKKVESRSKIGEKKKRKKNRDEHNGNIKVNGAAAPKSVCIAEGIDVCRTAYKRLINEMIEILLGLDFKEDHVDIHRYRLQLSKIDDDFRTIFTPTKSS
jgi:tetratricopeptide (TPR) repeat protein